MKHFKLYIEKEDGTETRVQQHGTMQQEYILAYRNHGLRPPYESNSFRVNNVTLNNASGWATLQPTYIMSLQEEEHRRQQMLAQQNMMNSFESRYGSRSTRPGSAQYVVDHSARSITMTNTEVTEEPAVDPSLPNRPAPSRGFFNRLGRFISGDR
jgi:hypothetical protein